MLIHMVQHFAAGFGHDDKVLHAHAKLARQVYARLNGYIDRVFHIEENIRKMKDAELEAALKEDYADDDTPEE